MIDETPRSYSIRCRRCADSVMIDVPFGVRTQAGYVECSRGHVTTYRFDGVTVVTQERAAFSLSALPHYGAADRPLARRI
jgi:hypothetical protein